MSSKFKYIFKYKNASGNYVEEVRNWADSSYSTFYPTPLRIWADLQNSGRVSNTHIMHDYVFTIDGKVQEYKKEDQAKPSIERWELKSVASKVVTVHHKSVETTKKHILPYSIQFGANKIINAHCEFEGNTVSMIELFVNLKKQDILNNVADINNYIFEVTHDNGTTLKWGPYLNGSLRIQPNEQINIYHKQYEREIVEARSVDETKEHEKKIKKRTIKYAFQVGTDYKELVYETLIDISMLTLFVDLKSRKLVPENHIFSNYTYLFVSNNRETITTPTYSAGRVNWDFVLDQDPIDFIIVICPKKDERITRFGFTAAKEIEDRLEGKTKMTPLPDAAPEPAPEPPPEPKRPNILSRLGYYWIGEPAINVYVLATFLIGKFTKNIARPVFRVTRHTWVLTAFFGLMYIISQCIQSPEGIHYILPKVTFLNGE